MNLQFLEDMLVLLEEGSLNRAAARRNVTQPAFSRRVRAVEDWIGTPLLDRGANRVELLPSLVANEDEIKSLVQRIDELKQNLVNFDKEQVTISIATQHALILSAFPDMVALARNSFPNLNFRLRAGNNSECVSMFLRGDASMLLRYEDQHTRQMAFDQSVERHEWGKDSLVPVVGGGLRHLKIEGAEIPENTPAIVYPPDSYFGSLLLAEGKNFALRRTTGNTVLESAFSAGIKEMALASLGIAWLPLSMVYRELEAGKLADLSALLGSCDLTIAFYINSGDRESRLIKSVWSKTRFE